MLLTFQSQPVVVGSFITCCTYSFFHVNVMTITVAGQTVCRYFHFSTCKVPTVTTCTRLS